MFKTESFWPTNHEPKPPISNEELEYLFMIDKEEMLWKKSQPKYSFTELMRIFPEAVKSARSGLKVKLKYFKQKLQDVNVDQENYYEKIIAPAHFSKQAELKEESDKYFDDIRKRWVSRIKQTIFNLSHLDEMDGKLKPLTIGGVPEPEVARVKEVPIIDLLGMQHITGRGNRAVCQCPFHPDKQPSFTIYLDQNTWWCYSCNTGGTSIDFIMRQQNVDFLTAVKFLLK